MNRVRKAMIVAGAIAATLVGSVQAASATDYVGWYSYPGFQSTWHCNSTSSYALGSGQGWAYVQACEALNGSYYQGLVNVSFSQAHSNVSINVGNDTNNYTFDDRTCSGGINGGERTCFARTEYPINPNVGAWADVSGFTVDGVSVDLYSPASGGWQVSSPQVW